MSDTKDFEYALSIRQPWADLILLGIKDIENRSRRWRYRGTILVHASRRVERAVIARYLPELSVESAAEYEPVTGALLGRVDIVDCVEDHSSRFFVGPYGYVLKNAKRLREPVGWPGRVGLFRVPKGVVKR